MPPGLVVFSCLCQVASASRADSVNITRHRAFQGGRSDESSLFRIKFSLSLHTHRQTPKTIEAVPEFAWELFQTRQTGTRYRYSRQLHDAQKQRERWAVLIVVEYVGFTDEDVYYYIGERLKLDGETENMGV